MKGFQKAELTGIIAIEPKKCKGCDSCKSFCPTNAITGKYGAVHSIDNEKCVFCGQCLVNCPFGAPRDTADKIDAVIARLKDTRTTVIGVIAPAVRVAIGEEFGMEPGALVTGKLYGAMKQTGFTILDNNFAADQCIMEEGSELIAKIRHFALGEPDGGHHLGPLPQFTSCCPAWVRYAELYHSQLLPHLSSAKSPQQMAGALAKTYAAGILKVKPEDMYVVGIMPCTAKKFEASRPEFSSAAAHWRKHGLSGDYPDIDTVLTTRDLAELFRRMKINLAAVPEFSDPGNPLARYSGAGTIFGNTGGVMEAALRTAYFVITGKELETLEFTPVRGLKGVKTAGVTMKDAKTGKEITLKVAVVHGIKDNLSPIVAEVAAGKSPYHFIEVMNCPGGCVNGGGQPINPMGTSWIDKYKAILPWA